MSKPSLTVSASLRMMDGWTALADPTRRRIFELVVARPRAVGELATQVPVTRPAVSQHLKLLKSAGLVRDHAEGTRRVYRVDRAGLAELRAQLDRFWNEALANFKEIAEQAEEDA
jgi:DNA-binding transcriptional ArsR family regulator